MRVNYDGYDVNRSREDLKRFMKEYLDWNNKLKGEWIEINGFKSKL